MTATRDEILELIEALIPVAESGEDWAEICRLEDAAQRLPA